MGLDEAEEFLLNWIDYIDVCNQQCDIVSEENEREQAWFDKHKDKKIDREDVDYRYGYSACVFSFFHFGLFSSKDVFGN